MNFHDKATAHGFRSTFRGWAAERTSTPHHVAEMALAHTIKNHAEAAYRRGDLLAKRANLMQQWADFLTTIEAALVDALAVRGVTGLVIRADGDVHRFDAPDKRRGNLSGWYVCPTLEVAVFGFWHTGEQHTVTLRGEYDPVAAEQARQAADKVRRQRQQQRESDQPPRPAERG